MGGDEAVGLAFWCRSRAARRHRVTTSHCHASYAASVRPVTGRKLTATFDTGRLSSDGGMIVMREIAIRLGLAEVFTGHLRDDRDAASRLRHSYAEMATARILMIASGYEDFDDINALKSDPALKIAVSRAPETGADLMSQPTVSRLENRADWRALARIALGQIDVYCRSFAKPPSRIVFDIDDTDDPCRTRRNTEACG